jgi:predicted aspartyl protease
VGTFNVALQIGDPRGAQWDWIEALADTGASYTWVPARVLAGVGVEPAFRFPFLLADGRSIERDAAETRVRLYDDERTTIVIFGDDGTQPLLGAYTLEAFRLAVDPVNHRLIPVPALLM